jgi:hypothetical protein
MIESETSSYSRIQSKAPVIPSERAARAALPSANIKQDATHSEDTRHVQFRGRTAPTIPPEGATEAAVPPPVIPRVPPALRGRRQSTRKANPPPRLVNSFEVGNHYVAYETLAVILPEPMEEHPLIGFTATAGLILCTSMRPRGSRTRNKSLRPRRRKSAPTLRLVTSSSYQGTKYPKAS